MLKPSLYGGSIERHLAGEEPAIFVPFFLVQMPYICDEINLYINI